MDLVTLLSRKLEADYIIFATIDDPGTPSVANTLIVYSRDRYLENFSYPLEGTPCEQVVLRDTCIFPEKITDLFPEDALLEVMGIAGYAGVRLKDRDGLVVGFLVALFERPIRDPEKVLETLESYVDWASVEVGKIEAETRLLESEERFRTAFDLSPDILCISNIENGVFIDANEEFFGVTGYIREEVIGTPSLELGLWLHPEKRKMMVQAIHDSGYVKNMEMEFKNKDGSTGVGLLSATMISVENWPRLLIAVRDITERKRLEEDLRSAVKEKELLFKELHHRVKNNLQVITSLLKLQSDQIESPECREVLKTCSERIFSIAAIHEQLYHSKGLLEIDFGKFLENLAENLAASHADFSGVISHHVEAEGIVLDIESAIPCGMVVNELVSNALKHAFPQGREGTVVISLRHDRDGNLELRVADDGIGLPPDLDIRDTDTLGMQLVLMLVEKQLYGSLDVAKDKGTDFTVRFSKRKD
jgi:PAS domain S-box-containing protein